MLIIMRTLDETRELRLVLLISPQSAALFAATSEHWHSASAATSTPQQRSGAAACPHHVYVKYTIQSIVCEASYHQVEHHNIIY